MDMTLMPFPGKKYTHIWLDVIHRDAKLYWYATINRASTNVPVFLAQDTSPPPERAGAADRQSAAGWPPAPAQSRRRSAQPVLPGRTYCARIADVLPC